MKKLVFMFVAIAAISFASCGNKTAQAPAEDTIAVDTTEVLDTLEADTTVLKRPHVIEEAPALMLGDAVVRPW